MIENNIKKLSGIIKKANSARHDKALDQFADEELEMRRLLAISGSILALNEFPEKYRAYVLHQAL